MSFQAKVIADSIASNKARVTTFELTYPRIIHAEMMTHRAFSRNAASSRAIPVAKLIQRVLDDPFIPARFGKNQSGMQAAEWLEGEAAEGAKKAWLRGRDHAVSVARELVDFNAHKQLANRVLEPYQWYTAIFTATDFDNFFALRCHPDAQPEIQEIAMFMRQARHDSTPVELAIGEWHLPLLSDREELEAAGFTLDDLKMISTGRCARVSYLTHHGVRDPNADILLAMNLQISGHMSPFEHIATPLLKKYYGNFFGWKQFRKHIPNEANFGAR